jgi:membrane peptidoglycan carboxypeptidase
VQKSRLYFLLKQRQQRRNQKAVKTRSALTGVAKAVLALVVVAFAALIIWAGLEYSRISSGLPSIASLAQLLDRQKGELLTPTRLMDRTGKIVLAEMGTPASERKFLTIDTGAEEHFNPSLIKVVLAALEPNYWSDIGVAAAQLTNPAPATIAERLVLEVLLVNESPSTDRAIRMRLLATQALLDYGKNQVLEWYLNSVALGRNTFGAEAASRLYLGKSAQDLTLAESALLVGLMDSPALNPLDSPAAASDLQHAVLTKLMLSKAITPEQFAAALQETLPIQKVPSTAANASDALAALIADQLEPELSVSRLQRGGLVITTTLDAELQKQLQCTALTQLSRIENSAASGTVSGQANYPAALLLPTQNFAEPLSGLSIRGLILEPASGQVLAYLPPTTQTGEVLTDDLVQPGSLLAPVVALAGFARGESPGNLAWDVPASLPGSLAGAANPDGAFHGPVSLRSAVVNDYVVPLAALAQRITPTVVGQMGNSLGLDSMDSTHTRIEELFHGGAYPMLELAQTYATLADSGTRSGVKDSESGQIKSNLVLKVQDSTGKVLLDFSTPVRQSIVSNSLAFLINSVLSDDTARRPSLGYPNVLQTGIPSAAKIGQTQTRDQVWTVGYTPFRLALIGIRQSKSEPAAGQLQPTMAAGAWNALIQYASQGQPAQGWPRPADVSQVAVCSPSGLLPTSACPNVVNEVFLNGNEPTEPDTLYRRVQINRETGFLATIFTPASLVEERVTVDVPAEARDWALAAGLPLTPTRYDAIQNVPQDPRVHISAPALFGAVHGKVQILGTATDPAFKTCSVQVGAGINPTDWIQVGVEGQQPVTEGLLAEWDTAGLDGLYAVRLTVVDRSNQLKTAVIQVTVDNIPPQAEILNLAPASSLTPVMGVLTFSANVKDNVAVDRVEWWLDGKALQDSLTAPYTLVWQASSGTHRLSIKAWDTAGNETMSPELSFTVNP